MKNNFKKPWLSVIYASVKAKYEEHNTYPHTYYILYEDTSYVQCVIKIITTKIYTEAQKVLLQNIAFDELNHGLSLFRIAATI